MGVDGGWFKSPRSHGKAEGRKGMRVSDGHRHGYDSSFKLQVSHKLRGGFVEHVSCLLKLTKVFHMHTDTDDHSQLSGSRISKY